MVNVQAPPAGCDGPALALAYVSRYMAGTCIGDQRILADDGTHVTIRIKDYRHDGVEDVIPMTGVEFIRRFVQHLLPARLRCVRYAGLWGQRKRAEYLDQCRELLNDRARPAEEPETTIVEEAEEEEEQQEDEKAPKDCPRCHSRDLISIEHYWPDEHGQDVGRRQPAFLNGPGLPIHHPLTGVPP